MPKTTLQIPAAKSRPSVRGQVVTTPGFACVITPDQDLGFGAVLIAEFPDGGYQPLFCASSVNEAQEMVDHLLKHRPALADCTLRLWASGLDGQLTTAAVAEHAVKVAKAR